MFFGMHGGGMGGGGVGRGPGGFRVYRSHGGNPFGGGGGGRYGQQEDPRRRGGQQQQQQQRQQQQQQQQQEHPLGVMGQMLQLLPVILLLFLSLFSFPHEGQADRAYSLHRTERHPVARETSVEHVYPHIPYFVTPAFSRDHARDRRRLFQVEREVQQAYMHDLHRRCQMEQNDKARLVQAARRTFNREERQRKTEEAEALPMQSCERVSAMLKGASGGGKGGAAAPAPTGGGQG